jgi:hypothetical protein|tara:strand:- start:9534 stop:9785 length:252 start_codon:yes stop_codon:yes gene_type:complete
MKSKIASFLMIYGMISASLIYILINWPYTPADAIEDGKKMGAWGLLIDVAILLPLIIMINRRRKNKRERLKYQRNESERVGEV